ncbi:nitroreductase family protein [Tindallia californiensis]|uniref:Putative TM nitroreductase n=1 Tax=Tindallia californiensis TaxID=159292 RepID=A0A1H3QQY8_9FIRM|nr:nitroreductase family protein [Tindallia californiensis]SDZ15934.1 Putative TM nitroreductase [Tindallia californiensis]
MMQETYYSWIFKRKSSRKFIQEGLKEERIQSILEAMEGLTPLESDIKTEIKIMDADSMKGLLAIKAPHYVLIYSEEKPNNLENAGFLLQQVDLMLSAMGIGSCWLGLGKPTEKAVGKDGMNYVIALAIGPTAEPVHRQSTTEFKRKKREEIYRGNHFSSVVEALRLAPSATNSQPWFLVEEENNLHAFCVKKGKLKAMFYEEINRIDMGIGLCHLWLAGLAEGYEVHLFRERAEKEPTLPNYEYTYSASFKKNK